MKFRIKKENIYSFINKAYSVSNRDSIRDASDCIYLKIIPNINTVSIDIAATDNRIYYKKTEIEAEKISGEYEKEILVPASEFRYELSLMQYEFINFEIKDKKLIITNDKNDKHVFLLERLEKLPVYPNFNVDYEQIQLSYLKSLIGYARKFTAKNEPEKALEGVYFKNNTLIAMNRNYGMLAKKIQTQKFEESIFDISFYNILKLFNNDSDIYIGKDKEFNKMLFYQNDKQGKSFYGVILINRQYPFYVPKEIVEKYYKDIHFTLLLNTSELKQIIKQLKGYSGSQDKSFITFSYSDNTLLCSKEGDLAKGTIELNVLKIDATSFSITVNIKSLESILSLVQSDTVQFDFNMDVGIAFVDEKLNENIDTLSYLKFKKN